MSLLITGGTGLLGRALVLSAEGAGHAVRVLSRRPRPETSRVEYAVGTSLAHLEGRARAIAAAAPVGLQVPDGGRVGSGGAADRVRRPRAARTRGGFRRAGRAAA